MSIWDWLYAEVDGLREDGHHRLASLVMEVPSHTVNGDIDTVDALVHEGLAATAELGRPWLDVFLRHWWLQARVAHGARGEAAMHDAIDALERAHRPEAEGCPQAICTVQDLCIAYRNTDGVGYAAERLAVCDEILDDLSPSIPCFTCISNERGGALNHAGRHEESIAFLDQQARRTTERSTAADDFRSRRIDAYLALGRIDDARRLLDQAEASPNQASGRSGFVARRLDRARVEAAAGDLDAARDALPMAEDLTPDLWAAWVEVSEATAPNDSDLRARVRSHRDSMVRSGSWDYAARLALAAVRRTRRAGYPLVAERDLEVVDEITSHLRDPGRLADHRAAAADTPVGVPSDDDVESHIEVLASAVEMDPTHTPSLAMAWADAGDLGHAQRLVEDALDAGVDASELPFALVEIALGDGSGDRLRAVEDRLGAIDPSHVDFAWARFHAGRDEWDRALERAVRVIEAAPDAWNSRRIASDACVEMGRFDEAVRWASEIVDALGDEAEGDRWRIVVAATAAGQWDAVREQGRHFGWDVEPGDGPFLVDGGPCRLIFVDGPPAVAERISPALARVISVDPPWDDQRAAATVLLEPMLRNPDALDADPEALPEYRAIRILEDGHVDAFEVLGHDGTADDFDRLRAMLADVGGLFWIHNRGFELHDGSPGFWAVASLPPGADVAAVLQAFDVLSWPGALVSSQLAAAAGDEATAERYRAVEDATA